MERKELLRSRVETQGLSELKFDSPEQAVRAFVAVQSQDFGNAKWSLGQRVRDCTDPRIQDAFDAGRFIRTHILRPTWHFVHPADIRWLLALTSPHVHRRNRTMYRTDNLTQIEFDMTAALLTRHLAGHIYLTRNEIGELLAAEGISADGRRLSHIVMQAELEGIICSGPMRGKQHTYALVDERVPFECSFTPDDPLTELTLRFFESHGPATARDFARWSGFTLTASRDGIARADSQLLEVEVDGLQHYMVKNAKQTGNVPDHALLLPEFDECYLTYPDLTFRVSVEGVAPVEQPGHFHRPLFINLERVGIWKRTLRSKAVEIDLRLFEALPAEKQLLLDEALQRYQKFIGKPLEIRVTSDGFDGSSTFP